MKDLEIQENIPLYCAVLLGAALLLTVAYHAFAVYGARIYKERSDVLSKNWSEAEVNKKVNAVLAMGRVFAFAIVNAAYLFAVFVVSFPRFFGRFETSTFVTQKTTLLFQSFLHICLFYYSAFALTVGFPASALAFVGSALL